jgi:hypothetical protein
MIKILVFIAAVVFIVGGVVLYQQAEDERLVVGTAPKGEAENKDNTPLEGSLVDLSGQGLKKHQRIFLIELISKI